MKFTKILGVVAVAAMALMAFASSASATTLTIGGAKQNSAVTIKSTLKSGTSALLTDTFGAFANTCTSSTVEGKSSVFTPTVSGSISALSWSSCTEGNPTVNNMGSLSVSWIKNTINGTVRSIGANVTVPSALGTLTCTTASGEGTDIGTLTGVSSTASHATMDINAVLSCGAITAKWSGTYTVTSPTGLGVAE
jgi:hypothetical protein